MNTSWLIHVLFNAALFLLVAPFITLLGKVLFQSTLSLRRLLFIFAVTAGGRAIALLFFPVSITGYFLQATAYFLACAVGLKFRKWRLISGYLVILACSILSDFIMMRMMTSLFDYETLYLGGTSAALPILRPSMFPALVIISVGSLSGVLALVCLLKFAFAFIRRQRFWPLLRVVRPFAITAITLAWVFWVLLHSDQSFIQLDLALLASVTYDQVITVILIMLLATYVTQDFMALHLSRQNETLQQQQRIYDDLLVDTRTFRHNIANMLYGFEGKILSGDLEEIQNYYEHMAKACARTNNENAVALGRIPNISVRALLLNKLHQAITLEIPVHLNVEQDIKWRGLKDGDMCQLLGVLIDNAIEAAQCAKSPHVAIEFSKIDSAMEIVIRNTFNADQAELSFLFGKVDNSSKEDHERLGIQYAKTIVQKHSCIIMNQLQRGRYIETLLQFEQGL